MSLPSRMLASCALVIFLLHVQISVAFPQDGRRTHDHGGGREHDERDDEEGSEPSGPGSGGRPGSGSQPPSPSGWKGNPEMMPPNRRPARGIDETDLANVDVPYIRVAFADGAKSKPPLANTLNSVMGALKGVAHAVDGLEGGLLDDVSSLLKGLPSISLEPVIEGLGSGVNGALGGVNDLVGSLLKSVLGAISMGRMGDGDGAELAGPAARVLDAIESGKIDFDKA